MEVITMAYTPTIWINDDGTGLVGTPASANNFNNMEQGIKNNDLAINEHSIKIEENTEQINDLLADPTMFPIKFSTGLEGNMSYSQNVCYKKHGYVTIEFRCKKTDGTLFATGNTTICQLPLGFRTGAVTGLQSACCYANSVPSGFTGVASTLIAADGNIIVSNSLTNTKEIGATLDLYVGGGTL